MNALFATRPKAPGKNRNPRTPAHELLRAKIKATALLDQHLKPVGDGTFRYDMDWTDSRIAAEAGLSQPNMRHLRMMLHGPLAHSVTESGALRTARRVNYLELVVRHERLADQVKGLIEEVARLKASLGE